MNASQSSPALFTTEPDCDIGRLLRHRARASTLGGRLSELSWLTSPSTMPLVATPSEPGTPQLSHSHDGNSTGSEYSPSIASVRTAVRLDAGQTRVHVENGFKPARGLPAHLSPPLRAVKGNTDRQTWEGPDAAFEDAEADDRKMSIYGGPKMKLISPPPWDAEEVKDAASLRRPSQDAPRAASPSFGHPRGKVQGLPGLPGLGPPLRASPSSREMPEDVSFLDLAGSSSKKRGDHTSPPHSASSTTIKRKNSISGRQRSPSTPSRPLPKVNGASKTSPPVKRPPLPTAGGSSRSLATSAGSPVNETTPTSPTTPASTTSGAAVSSRPSTPAAAFNLISLEQARSREQDRIKAAAGDRKSPQAVEMPLPPQTPKLRNKRSGFLRMFKKADEDSPMPVPTGLPTPPNSASTTTGVSLDDSPTAGRGTYSPETVPMLVPPPPQSAPPTIVTFRDVASASAPAPGGAFREKGIAPSLSLRPVSMAISGLPTGFLADAVTQQQLEPPSPTSEGVTSPSAASFTSGTSELAAVDEQVAAAKAAWQRQIAKLEEQVKLLQAEVDTLRPSAPAGGFKECETCGCTCAARKQALSVMHRPKQKIEGDGERSNLFANRHF